MITLMKKLANALPLATSDIILYGIGGSLTQLVAFLTTPVISRILTPGELGNTQVITAATGYFLVLMTMNIATGLMRFYYEIESADQTSRIRLISSSFWFVLAFGGVVTAGLTLIAAPMSESLFGSGQHAIALIYAMIALWLSGLNDLIKNVLRIQKRPLRFLIQNLVFAATNFGLILLFVVYFQMAVEGFFLAQAIAGALMVAAGLWQIRSYIRLTYSGEWFNRMMRYSLPTMPGYLFYWGLTSVTAILLTQYTTDAEIGYYTMASKVAKIVELIITAFTLGWLPVFLENINSASFHRKLTDVFRYYNNITLTLAAMVVLFAKELFLVFGPPEYLAGVGLVGLLCLKQLLLGVTFTYTVGITQKKQTYWISIANAVGLLVTVGMSLLLMPRIGKMGAAIADVLGMAVFAAVEYFASQRLVPLKLNFGRAFASLGLFLTVWLASLWITLASPVIDLLLRIAMAVAFVFVLYVIIDRRETMTRIRALMDVSD